MLTPMLALTAALISQAKPIALHPVNPHYFLFRGKPTVLITSGEHYGAVLNRDFNYVPYLDELHAWGFNLTRVFSGTYHEIPGSFKIQGNTLSPAPGRYLGPWARSQTTGAADGGNKFDLDAWDDAYFDRLKDCCTQAGKRGIVVEFVLFCPFYEEDLWDVNPMNAKNNVNGVGNIPRTEVYTLKHPDLLAWQEAFVRKVVGELKGFDNLYYEICNEPYFGGVTLDWQGRIAAAIDDAERCFPHKHLIAQNIANESARIERPNPLVSIFNFHYASPEAARANDHLNKILGDDETGFKGTADQTYRTEGWEFLLSGGAIYDNLDYSFIVGHERGTAKVSDPTPGGGGPSLRQQLQILKDFIESFDFLRMAPDTKSITARLQPGAAAHALALLSALGALVVAWAWGQVIARPARGPITRATLATAGLLAAVVVLVDQWGFGMIPKDDSTLVRVLSKPGKAYAAYVSGGDRVQLSLDLPTGAYRAEWVNPRTGTIDKAQDLEVRGDRRTVLESPAYIEDIALRIKERPRSPR